VLRRVEIGLAGAKADDVLAGRLQLARLLRDGDGGRRLDAVETLGKERHVSRSPMETAADSRMKRRRRATPHATNSARRPWLAIAPFRQNSCHDATVQSATDVAYIQCKPHRLRLGRTRATKSPSEPGECRQ